MKECDITQDLLIAYFDGTLKEGSKEFVENHLETCEICKEMLEELKNDIVKENEKIEIDYMKKLRKRNIIKNILLTFLGMISILFIIISVISFKTYFQALKVEIFFEDNISENQIENIINKIKEVDENVQIQYVSSNDALENMKEKLGEENKDLLKEYENKNVFPSSLVIKGKGKVLLEIEKTVENMDGIKHVNSTVNLNPYLMFGLDMLEKVR